MPRKPAINLKLDEKKCTKIKTVNEARSISRQKQRKNLVEHLAVELVLKLSTVGSMLKTILVFKIRF